MFLVLGLGLEHSCPWPQEVLSSERLSLASDFFCVLGLGLEPCVLDSTSGKYRITFEFKIVIASFCLLAGVKQCKRYRRKNVECGFSISWSASGRQKGKRINYGKGLLAVPDYDDYVIYRWVPTASATLMTNGVISENDFISTENWSVSKINRYRNLFFRFIAANCWMWRHLQFSWSLKVKTWRLVWFSNFSKWNYEIFLTWKLVFIPVLYKAINIYNENFTKFRTHRIDHGECLSMINEKNV